MTQPTGDNDPTVDFGTERVSATEKTARVNSVFDAVANRYDLMNDLMSLGTHRFLKRMTVEMSGVSEGARVLDLAGGTGDVSSLYAPIVGHSGVVVLTDPNGEMLGVGRDRLLDAGAADVAFCQGYGEALPFADDTFDCATISFGLRNFTDKVAGLDELLRVLRPTGVLLVLEFSHPQNPLMQSAATLYQTLWPIMGRAVVGDAAPYQYLVDSIAKHPKPEALKLMIEDAGFVDVSFHRLLGGVAAIHRGVKP